MSSPLRLLVFGGRDFADREWLYAVLDRIHSEPGISVIIQGDEPGTDTMTREWAESRRVPVEIYAAAWSDLSAPGAHIKRGRHGDYNARAGHDRNQRMIDEGKPDAAVQISSGAGTTDMARRLRVAGLPIWERIGS